MAKPQVTLTLAGDATQLEKTFDSVGASAREMGGDVESASAQIGSSGESFDAAGESFDAAEQRAMGFRDTITGLQDGFKGLTDDSLPLSERLLLLGTGVGDLASGFANFLIPAMKNMTRTAIANTVATVRNTASMAVQRVATIASTAATKAMTVAQRALNLVMRANPLGLVITALFVIGGALVFAWKRSRTFRDVVRGAMRGAAAAFRFVVDAGRNLLGWFSRLPGAIFGMLTGLAHGLRNIFWNAFNGIREVWNSTIGGRGFTTPNWIPFGLGGRRFQIPFLHSGGVMPGAPGSEGLAMLQAGEQVIPAGGGGPPVVLEIRSGGSRLDELLVELLRHAIRARGGNVVQVLGNR